MGFSDQVASTQREPFGSEVQAAGVESVHVLVGQDILMGVFNEGNGMKRHRHFHAINVREIPVSGGVKVWGLEIAVDPAATRAFEPVIVWESENAQVACRESGGRDVRLVWRWSGHTEPERERQRPAARCEQAVGCGALPAGRGRRIWSQLSGARAAGGRPC